MKSRRFKILLLCFALLLAIIAFLGGSGYTLLRGTPDFYRRHMLTADQIARIAETAEEKIAQARNWLARTHAQETARVAGRTPATAAASAPNAITMTFSEDELNAFFDKWSETAGWRDAYLKYLSNPVLVLKDGQLILAGTVKNFDSVVSLHFRPTLDAADDQLRLDLTRIQVGRLPVPESFFSSQEQRLVNALRARLPGWQSRARIQPNGTSNGSAVAAAMGKLALDSLQHRPADAALFLPLEGDKFIPVRLTNLKIDGDHIALTATPLDAEERATLLHHLKEPYNAPRLAAAAQ